MVVVWRALYVHPINYRANADIIWAIIVFLKTRIRHKIVLSRHIGYPAHCNYD